MKIKILWIVNMVLPDLACHIGISAGASGTWMENLSKAISNDENFDLRIACVYGDKFSETTVGNITYYMLPGNGKSLLFYTDFGNYWQKIEERFAPDIVHIHGTEYSHSISYMRKYPDKKYLLTIQGIINKIAPKDDGELSFIEKLSNRTLHEWLRMNGMIEKKLLMKKNSKYELEIIKSVRYATGRTDWDKAFLEETNPDIKYFRVFYNLRDAFYTCDKWDIAKAEKHKIYASTSTSRPFKGGHIFIKALAKVKERIPDVKAVFIAPSDGNGKMVVTNGYTKYIAKLIDKYGLWDNVEFYSKLDTRQVIDTMRSCRVCVIPSAMENASATLRESMDLGVPSVAAFRGGMTDLILNGESGFQYDYPEYGVLAQEIVALMEDDDLAVRISENAKARAAHWHDQEKNTADLKEVYRLITENS